MGFCGDIISFVAKEDLLALTDAALVVSFPPDSIAHILNN
jgi:hypothetical protein